MVRRPPPGRGEARSTAPVRYARGRTGWPGRVGDGAQSTPTNGFFGAGEVHGLRDQPCRSRSRARDEERRSVGPILRGARRWRVAALWATSAERRDGGDRDPFGPRRLEHDLGLAGRSTVGEQVDVADARRRRRCRCGCPGGGRRIGGDEPGGWRDGVVGRLASVCGDDDGSCRSTPSPLAARMRPCTQPGSWFLWSRRAVSVPCSASPRRLAGPGGAIVAMVRAHERRHVPVEARRSRWDDPRARARSAPRSRGPPRVEVRRWRVMLAGWIARQAVNASCAVEAVAPRSRARGIARSRPAISPVASASDGAARSSFRDTSTAVVPSAPTRARGRRPRRPRRCRRARRRALRPAPARAPCTRTSRGSRRRR